jgi:peptidoglycan hydrolase-like protein with peptidoglycan-binding domain
LRPTESFVAQPVRSLQTMLRVLAEDDPTLPTVIPDGIFGPDTMNAVSSFQRRRGLPVTGIADQASWDALVFEYEKAIVRIQPAESIEIIMDPGQVFSIGDSSPYIYLLQSMLTQLSKDHTNITPPPHNGILDDATAASLASFQKLVGLPTEGTLDKITWKHLVNQFTLNAHHNTINSAEHSATQKKPISNYFINFP